MSGTTGVNIGDSNTRVSDNYIYFTGNLNLIQGKGITSSFNYMHITNNLIYGPSVCIECLGRYFVINNNNMLVSNYDGSGIGRGIRCYHVSSYTVGGSICGNTINRTGTVGTGVGIETNNCAWISVVGNMIYDPTGSRRFTTTINSVGATFAGAGVGGGIDMSHNIYEVV